MFKTRLAIIEFALITFLLSGPCLAATSTFTGSLSGPAESPANASPGTGTTTVIYDSTLHTLKIEVSFSGLTGAVVIDSWLTLNLR
jgi:CHRD domain